MRLTRPGCCTHIFHVQQPPFHPFFRIFGSLVQQTACIRQITAATAPIPIQNTGSTFIRFIMAIAPFISRLSLVVHCSSFWKETQLAPLTHHHCEGATVPRPCKGRIVDTQALRPCTHKKQWAPARAYIRPFQGRGTSRKAGGGLAAAGQRFPSTESAAADSFHQPITESQWIRRSHTDLALPSSLFTLPSSLFTFPFHSKLP